MSENEFELDGKVYVAVDGHRYSCVSCAFSDYQCYSRRTIPGCISKERKDKRNVIFVEKQP